MPAGHGLRARALDLVGVAAAPMHAGGAIHPYDGRQIRHAVAPSANRDTAGLLPRASRRSSAGVDADNSSNWAPERPGQSLARPVNPRLSGYAWYQNFNNGNQNNNDKGWSCRVRAVRKWITLMPSEITVAQLFEAYYDCRRNKRTTRSALAFEIDLETNLLDLLDDLRSGRWMPAPATVFAITRPKPREVWASTFRDRIVHHLVYRAVAPLFEPSFIADSCACIKGRGTLYGARRLQRHLLSATENWTKPAFVLKADIANFFGSVRHHDLFAMLSRRIRDTTMLNLCRKLVFQDVRDGAVVRGSHRDLARVPPHKSLFLAPPGIGLPIGNLSSQFFANVYLDGLDQMIKRRLGMRHYVRYVDDMVLVHADPKALLAAADAIRKHLGGIGLTLAERKTYVAPAQMGVDFVGHVIRPHRTSGRALTHRVALQRIATMPEEQLVDSCNSYLGLYRYVGTQAQRIDIARLAKRRGLRLNRELTKVVAKRRTANAVRGTCTDA